MTQRHSAKVHFPYNLAVRIYFNETIMAQNITQQYNFCVH